MAKIKKKFDENKLMTIPEEKALKTNIVDKLSRLKEENAGETESKKIKLSFEFFDQETKLFALGDIPKEWFTDLLNELKELTDITKKQVFIEYKDKYIPHSYIKKIDSLNYKDNYLTNPQYEAIQLRLTKSSGRLHGFFIENVYYIRFLDRWHNMYNSEGYPGVKYTTVAQTYAERLEIENKNQKEEIHCLESKMEKNLEILCESCKECNNDVFKKFEL